MRDWERSWLAWARPIVRTALDNPEHHGECRSLLDQAEYPHTDHDPASDPSLRWPGYVGADWIPERGILFIGSVHADFRKDGRTRGGAERVAVVASMANANRRWRDAIDGDREGVRYLEATRAAYASLIPGWTRDGAFATVRGELEEPISAIAWTNLAHCRARPRQTNEYKLQRICSGKNGAFPLGGLVEALRPAVILACVSPFDGTHRTRYSIEAADGWRPQVYAFSGSTGILENDRPDVWAPRVADEIRDLRVDRSIFDSTNGDA